MITTSFSRGISTWRFLRLCWRAPLILIVLAGIGLNCSNLSVKHSPSISPDFEPIMSQPGNTLSPEDIAQLQKKFSEIKHSINNALAVMMALSEMSQRRPDYAEKLASTVLSKAPQIVTSLQEFTQVLNEKAGQPPVNKPA